MRLIFVFALALVAGLLPLSRTHAGMTGGFFDAPVDPGASLSPAGIYPHGRRMAYMGYSGKPARDLETGFTVAGPVYGAQEAYLAECIKNHWPVVAQVPSEVRFVGAGSEKKQDFDAAVKGAEAFVAKYAGNKEILWWSVLPEELRPWMPVEMAYLNRMTQAIRAKDPLKRPIFLYNPNLRSEATLLPIAHEVDILGKGCYVNWTDRKNNREWIRSSIQSEVAAAETASKTKRGGVKRQVTPILMPELCADPAKAEFGMIETWVRHDVYLGLCSGAKGVLIWSLFPRPGVKASWKLWYDAYARCGREIGDERRLGEVFLFGESRKNILLTSPHESKVATKVAAKAAKEAKVTGTKPNSEDRTTNADERRVRPTGDVTVTFREIAFGKRRYFFVVNSRNKPRSFKTAGWPGSARFSDAFTGADLAAADVASFTLPAWGVAGFVAEAK